jgi:hypothetical protein
LWKYNKQAFGLELQQTRSNSRISGSGLRFLPVLHEGNQNSCPEEADAIRDLVAEILNSKAMFIDSENKERGIALRDILIIAPYNAQVFELEFLRAVYHMLLRALRGLAVTHLRIVRVEHGCCQPVPRDRVEQIMDQADNRHVTPHRFGTQTHDQGVIDLDRHRRMAVSARVRSPVSIEEELPADRDAALDAAISNYPEQRFTLPNGILVIRQHPRLKEI